EPAHLDIPHPPNPAAGGQLGRDSKVGFGHGQEENRARHMGPSGRADYRLKTITVRTDRPRWSTERRKSEPPGWPLPKTASGSLKLSMRQAPVPENRTTPADLMTRCSAGSVRSPESYSSEKLP